MVRTKRLKRLKLKPNAVKKTITSKNPKYWLSKRNWSVEEMDSFIDTTLQWCHNNFGKTRKALPTVEWDWADRDFLKEGISGEYYYDGNFIGISIRGHRTVVNLVNTIIHEYIHYLQPHKGGWYTRYQNTVGYDKNPYEMEANYFGKGYEIQCLEWVFTELGWVK